jgi:hypothetical protein
MKARFRGGVFAGRQINYWFTVLRFNAERRANEGNQYCDMNR